MNNVTPQYVTAQNQVLEDDEDRYQELSSIGLSELESKVYLSLVKHPDATIRDLPTLASIPRNKLHKTLRKLWQMGFVEQKLQGRRKVYAAIEPQTAIRRILEEDNERAQTRHERGLQLAAKLTPVFLAGQVATHELSYMSFVQNPIAIRQRFNELQEQVHKEILLFSKGPYAVSPEDNVGELAALKRGVQVRVIYEIGEAVNRTLQDTIERYAQAGEQVRVHPELPVKLAIFDRRVVLLSLNDPATTQPSMVTLIIHHPDLALMLRKSFEHFWTESIEWCPFLERGVAAG